MRNQHTGLVGQDQLSRLVPGVVLIGIGGHPNPDPAPTREPDLPDGRVRKSPKIELRSFAIAKGLQACLRHRSFDTPSGDRPDGEAIGTNPQTRPNRPRRRAPGLDDNRKREAVPRLAPRLQRRQNVAHLRPVVPVFCEGQVSNAIARGRKDRVDNSRDNRRQGRFSETRGWELGLVEMDVNLRRSR